MTSAPLTLTLIKGTSDEAEVGLPVVDALGTPWPHPVNGTAHVAYKLTRAGTVYLTLYDALGREVRTLARGVRTAGQHRTAWSAKGLPAGVYVLRLRTETGVQTRRVTVVR